MTAGRTCADYLEDIVSEIEKIARFVGAMTYAQFVADEKTSYAVIRAFEIIGEATKQVPQAIRVRHPHIPWKEMAGMRDKLIHDYFGHCSTTTDIFRAPFSPNAN